MSVSRLDDLGAEACGRIRKWLFEAAFPLWSGLGRDAEHGGFFEKLTLDGAPERDAVRRLRVQARQIYSFAVAAETGWPGPAAQIVSDGFDWVAARAWRREGGWAHLLAPDGAILDGSCDAYDHAFMLLACAHVYRTTARDDALDWASRTLTYMDEYMAAPALDDGWGGYLEGAPSKKPRRQNPHMHFLEAMLALYEASGEPEYLQRTEKIVGLFRKKFWDADSGFVYEIFDDDWTRIESEAGRMIEPGHLYEWVWLLSQAERRGIDGFDREIEGLFSAAEKWRVGDYGFALDGVRDDGRLKKRTRRLWPQTEALRACLAMKEAGRADTDARIRQLRDGLFAEYLNVEPAGAWIDQFDEDGAALAADIPASSFYHVLGAFSECLRIFTAPSAAPPAAKG
ncbi:MAG: hypothetical protein Tsb0010_11210 [Parvularculaceae bacterium]